MTSVETFIAALELDRSLLRPAGLRRRIEALDRLEARLWDGHDRAGGVETTRGAGLDERATAIRARLEAVNDDLYEGIRRDIRRGDGSDPLRRWAPRSGGNGRAAPRSNGDRYDHLDALLSGVLRFELADAPVAELPEEAVPYQPTPARHIFDLIDRTGLTERDVLVDLGSGLGHVPLVASIRTGVRGIGIELEPAYVECARRSADSLDLTDVAFVRQDVRAADLSTGTVFYLYTPFTGGILRDVLDSLRREAVDRTIRVCTFGPCAPAVAEQPWLEAVGPVETDRVGIFRSLPSAIHRPRSKRRAELR